MHVADKKVRVLTSPKPQRLLGAEAPSIAPRLSSPLGTRVRKQDQSGTG